YTPPDAPRRTNYFASHFAALIGARYHVRISADPAPPTPFGIDDPVAGARSLSRAGSGAARCRFPARDGRAGSAALDAGRHGAPAGREFDCATRADPRGGRGDAGADSPTKTFGAAKPSCLHVKFPWRIPRPPYGILSAGPWLERCRQTARRRIGSC